jgi:hypothetical protein
MDRYRTLLQKASGRPSAGAQPTVRGPSFKLAPYFAVRNTVGDPWWDVNTRVWAFCESRTDAVEISPAIAVSNVATLGSALDAIPSGLSRTQFFWITDFDERLVDSSILGRLWRTVADQALKGKDLVNLYGGFFSICMSHAGLWGFNNGLGYSESRAWPQLTSTGAAPPRYYIRKLHAFASPGSAQLLINANPSFGCDCTACAGVPPIGMDYHGLKKHFALSRKWEIDLVASNTPTQLADALEASLRDFRTAKRTLPGSLGFKSAHLKTWADVLRAA